ncbi:unnamed protein product [Clavelina lepadiformis]|uniref:Tyrosine-protein kinase n=1 Tax=Clavelina lepadiformis TaxID=159417 RepID=A0ABP0GLF7_CLALP
MEFELSMLGKSAHNAVIELQDSEIQLFEIMKQTIAMRAKCDNEYADSLIQVAMHGSKLNAPRHNSFLFKAWEEIVCEMLQKAKCIKSSSETLLSETNRTLMDLIVEKKAFKKAYLKTRERIDNEFTKVVHTTLEQKQKIYSKLESEANSAHQNYKNLVEKGKSSDKAQDRYRKCLIKLYNAHNDYVIQLEEARLHQQNYRDSLLPQLMKTVQKFQTHHTNNIKEFFLWYLHRVAPSRNEFITCHKLAKERVEEIDALLECREFAKSHSCRLDKEATISFMQLRGEAGTFPYNQIVVNRTTVQNVEQQFEMVKRDLAATQKRIFLRQKKHQVHEYVENNYSDMYDDSAFQDGFFADFESCEDTCLESKQSHITRLLDQLTNSSEYDDPGFDENQQQNKVQSPKKVSSNLFANLHKIFPTRPNPGEGERKDSNFNFTKPLQDQSWFHGAISRGVAESLLRNSGDFLIKQSTQNPNNFILSFKAGHVVRHIKITENDQEEYDFGEKSFDSIVELVFYHYNKRVPVRSTYNADQVLTKPVIKDSPGGSEFWKLRHDDIELKDQLGKGHFGVVYKGFLRSKNQWVAVKTYTMEQDAAMREMFLKEARITEDYDHPNIVKVIGASIERQPLYIVMELLTGGDLKKHLCKNLNLEVRELIGYCRDACEGLAYLEGRNCIHRDVAARNCLVSESNVVKITDFGMSREEEDGIYYSTVKKVPVKWTAIEAIKLSGFFRASFSLTLSS